MNELTSIPNVARATRKMYQTTQAHLFIGDYAISGLSQPLRASLPFQERRSVFNNDR